MIWTQERGLVPATMPRAVGRGCGHLSALVLGSLAALVLWLGFDVAWWWVVAAWPAAYVLGSLVGRRVGQLVLSRMEFSPSQVRLVGPTATRTIAISSVTDIEVRHSSHPLDDRRTSLLLTYGMAMGTTTVAVTNRYDPTLASALAELLGPTVRIRQSNPVDEP